jgi:uncharacterized delta-60 repeat protein
MDWRRRRQKGATTKRLGSACGAVLLSSVLIVAVAAAAPGDLDPSFGTGGVASIAVAPEDGDDFQNGLAVQRNGRIIVGGSSDMGPAAGGSNWRLLRYRSNGELDPSFGTGGVVTTNLSTVGGSDEHIWALALQPDGKIVAAGEARTAAGGRDWALARYNPDGKLDTTFGSDGKNIRAVGPGTNRDNLFDVALDGNGKIVVGGPVTMSTAEGGRNFAVARYNLDGTLDTSFNASGTTPGIVVTPVAPGANSDLISSMAVDGDGKIVVVGQANMGTGAGGFNFALARYNRDGTLDSSFDTDGKMTTAMAPGDNIDVISFALAIDDNGKILVGGVADMGTGAGYFDWALARYNADGSLDGSFDGDGRLTMPVSAGDSDDDLEGLVIQPTGKIMVGGSTSATEVTVDGDFALARYNPDGTLDSTFGSDGLVVTRLAPGTNDDAIFGIATQGGGTIVASGECVMGSTTGRDVCVARYNAGGDD